MSKRHRKSRDFNADVEIDVSYAELETPRTKRPKGKDWGKARRNNQKAAYWDN